ncbi:MAG TPA: UDP-3-O-(3-hydroxymyristoyl)glucosamine N-acyltransferase, partial [Candidatus Acidoferrum sp.]|nr:UDP-3-O-(3-hydroxymyristoyl)glucosamine N-acyltransferase [Candidatus Acidoferrum sp.]
GQARVMIPVPTLTTLAAMLGLELQGPVGCGSVEIHGLAPLATAGPNQLSFYHNPRYHAELRQARAAAVILLPEHAADCPVPRLISTNPYLTYARASHLFARERAAAAGIHASAEIDASASLGSGVSVAANVVIGAGAVIDDGVIIGANCVIGDGCRIGAGSRLYPNVTLYHGVALGRHCIVHSATVIGSDGFGFARAGGRYHKIAQLGGVAIGDDVEIGANTSIDRGALEDTVIGDGVKIDNQVQIAHNVRIGAHTVICGCSAIAGSSTIGKNCTIAGGVGVINHVSICDDVTVTAMSLVNQDIAAPGIYSSGTGLDDSGNWRRSIVRFRQLDDMWRRLLRLERKRND